MIISISEKLDVILKENTNYKGDIIYTVIYGLQVEVYTDFISAMEAYSSSVIHAASCEGYFEDSDSE